MQCTNPLHLHNEAGTVPCGKCTACRIRRAKEWSIRLMHESYFHDENLFLTLTYEEENLPKDGQINKKEAQNFIKRLRKHLGVDHKIRYYITGEYGDSTGRPHYHAIIFNLGLQSYNARRSRDGFHVLGGPIFKSWKKGFIYAGSVTPDSTRYVAEYIQKKLYGKPAVGKVQPFSLMSNGIGKEWINKNEEMLRRNLKITFQGKHYQVPKYYSEKLGLQTDLRMANDIYWQEQLSHYDNKYNRPGESTVAQIHHRRQINRNLNSYQNLRNKPL